MTTKQLAAERAEHIRLGLQQTAVLYAQAVEEQDWKVLGYRSVDGWAQAEFGPDRFSAPRRREIHQLLHTTGMTYRKIAQATGSSPPTVMRDIRNTGNGVTDVTEPAPTQPNPRQQAARDREQRRRDQETCPGDNELTAAEHPTQLPANSPGRDQAWREMVALGQELMDTLGQELQGQPPNAETAPEAHGHNGGTPTTTEAYDYDHGPVTPPGDITQVTVVLTLQLIDQFAAGPGVALGIELEKLRRQLPGATEIQLTIRQRAQAGDG
jgi:hypothetical protein